MISSNHYQPTREGAKFQINQLMTVLEYQTVPLECKTRIGNTIAFLQQWQHTLPTAKETMRTMSNGTAGGSA